MPGPGTSLWLSATRPTTTPTERSSSKRFFFPLNFLICTVKRGSSLRLRMMNLYHNSIDKLLSFVV